MFNCVLYIPSCDLNWVFFFGGGENPYNFNCYNIIYIISPKEKQYLLVNQVQQCSLFASPVFLPKFCLGPGICCILIGQSKPSGVVGFKKEYCLLSLCMYIYLDCIAENEEGGWWLSL